jgi:hypothetical protein
MFLDMIDANLLFIIVVLILALLGIIVVILVLSDGLNLEAVSLRD